MDKIIQSQLTAVREIQNDYIDIILEQNSKGTGPINRSIYNSTTPTFLFLFKFDVDEAAFERLAVEFCNGSACFVAFHLKKPEALALA